MSKRTSPDELADQLREISVALRRHARTEPNALPYGQLAVLKRLESDGPSAAANLARSEAMTPQSMGAIVAELEVAGYIVRRDDANHGRRRLVSITPAGRKIMLADRSERLRRTAALIAAEFDPDEQVTLANAFALLRRAFIS
ncbi:MAG: winged helix DNA-binding protein [Kofleriaceae bacterium]